MSLVTQSLDGDRNAGENATECALTNLIHDLRTPLVAVRGYARMLLEERAGGVLNSTQREYLNIVLENTNQVIRMLNDAEHLGRRKINEST
jgi:signal transduction histidine kinase